MACWAMIERSSTPAAGAPLGPAKYGTIVAAMAARCEDPTPATAKLLYGTAYQCAAPACRRTLYRIDDEKGDWELNSRIAHICAQSEGGPRWDPDMPCEQNRAPGNLLLLGLPHHTEVDDRHREFTVKVLRQWKAEQQRVAQDEGPIVAYHRPASDRGDRTLFRTRQHGTRAGHRSSSEVSEPFSRYSGPDARPSGCSRTGLGAGPAPPGGQHAASLGCRNR